MVNLAGQTVLDQWGGRQYLWHLLLAQKGYVVMSIDPRGTPSPQGSNWRKIIYGQLGWLAAQDHAAATKEVPNKFIFIDSTRVGHLRAQRRRTDESESDIQIPAIVSCSYAFIFCKQPKILPSKLPGKIHGSIG